MQLFIFLLPYSTSLSSLVKADCPTSEEDQYIIAAILENALANDCIALRKLSGIFFSSQERPPHSVKVDYTINIPIDKDCKSHCSCWNDVCNTFSETCPDEYCCIKKEFLWGRIPLLVEDEIYRTLAICPFMLESNTQKNITTNLTLNNTSNKQDEINCIIQRKFPCGWCIEYNGYTGQYKKGTNSLDDVGVYAERPSPLDKALITLTEKLQGYAVKSQKLPWLTYSSNLAIGYAAPYPVITKRPLVVFRYLGSFVGYFLFHVMIFMLVYKHRQRLYRRTYIYINIERINNAFFFSFVMTTILTGFSMLMVTIVHEGLCLSLFEMLLLGIALLFTIPHGLVSCFHLKKIPNFFVVSPFFCCCVRWKCMNYIIQVLIFWLLYSIPHVLLYLILEISMSFIYNPFSYLVLLMYLGLSIITLWIGNALFLHLSTPFSSETCSICTNKTDRRRFFFALCLVIAFNVLYYTLWDFVVIYFYDIRGRSVNYLTFIPGFAMTFLGWYLSGDLVKLFDMFTRSKTSDEEEYIAINDDEITDNENENKSEDISLDDLALFNTIQERGQQARYSVKRLRRFVNVVTRPSSLIYQDNNESTPPV